MELGLNQLDLHVLEEGAEFFKTDLVAIIHISLAKERLQCLAMLLQTYVDLFEYALLQSDDIVGDLQDDTALPLCSLLVVLEPELVALEDAQESLIVDARLLITPEVIDKFIQLGFLQAQVHVSKRVPEVIPRYGAGEFLIE